MGSLQEGMLSRQHLSCFLLTSLNTCADELWKRICSDFMYVSVVLKMWLPARSWVDLEIFQVSFKLFAMACPSVCQCIPQTQQEKKEATDINYIHAFLTQAPCKVLRAFFQRRLKQACTTACVCHFYDIRLLLELRNLKFKSIPTCLQIPTTNTFGKIMMFLH